MRTWNTYPTLHDLLQRVAADKGSVSDLRESPRWPRSKDYLEALESDARKMSERERDVFAAGEREECLEVVRRHRLQRLDAFLDASFDGPYRSRFFKY